MINFHPISPNHILIESYHSLNIVIMLSLTLIRFPHQKRSHSTPERQFKRHLNVWFRIVLKPKEFLTQIIMKTKISFKVIQEFHFTTSLITAQLFVILSLKGNSNCCSNLTRAKAINFTRHTFTENLPATRSSSQG